MRPRKIHAPTLHDGATANSVALRRLAVHGVYALLTLACGSADTGQPIDPNDPNPADGTGVRAPPRVRPAFCERPGSDRIRDLFCTESSAPAVPQAVPQAVPIDNLLQLQTQLGFDPTHQGAQFSVIGSDLDNIAYNFIVVLAHSTALSGHIVSPINPRIFFIRNDTFMAFQRGVQRVELIGRDRDSGRLNFYLLHFVQQCNRQQRGCAPGDLFTPEVEHHWTHVAIHDDEELKNTPQDCRQCHARGREAPQILMRELNPPWTHFFQPWVETLPPHPEPGVTGVDLTQDYVRAHGDEPYASVPGDVMRRTSAVALQDAAGVDQPLLFDSRAILSERWPEALTSTDASPLPSAIWEAAYAAYKRGDQLALPYVEPRATDPTKQAQLSDAYASYRRGALAADALPDLADIFPDDPELRARVGLQVEPGAGPVAALIQACGSCHNDRLDQSVSRARFSVDVSRLDRTERERAIERIQLPAQVEGAMPPPEARQLDDAARRQLIDFLRDDAALQPVAALRQAAERGMVDDAAAAD